MDALEQQQPESTSASITITPELLIGLMREMSRESREATIEAIREFKKPSEDDQRKQEETREREMALTLRRVDAARREEEKQATAWRNCSHTMPNGKTRFRGQVNSNGFAQAFCQECHYLSKPFIAAPHELTGGLNIHDWQGNVFAVIQQRIKNSPPPPPIPDIPPGARIIF